MSMVTITLIELMLLHECPLSVKCEVSDVKQWTVENNTLVLKYLVRILFIGHVCVDNS